MPSKSLRGRLGTHPKLGGSAAASAGAADFASLPARFCHFLRLTQPSVGHRVLRFAKAPKPGVLHD